MGSNYGRKMLRYKATITAVKSFTVHARGASTSKTQTPQPRDELGK
jgi:hypothetical protein